MSQTHEGPDHGSPHRTPRWVKVFGIIALVLVVLVVIMLLIGGSHGPSRHTPSGSVRGDIPHIEHVVADAGNDLLRGADGPHYR